MSSSSATACSRSPSPTPTTPDASDSLEPAMSQDLSAWCKSLPNADFLLSGGIQFGDHGHKTEERPTLSLEDLLQEHVYEDATPAAHEVAPESMFCPVTNPSSPDVSISGLTGTHQSIASTKPIPPPAQIRKDPPAVQRVVFPEKAACSNLPIMFPSLPEGGTKSRVETQIRLTVDLAHASASSGEPFKYDKVGSWKWLRLPKGTSTKKRTRKEGKVDAPIEETLYLTAEITCATPPNTRVIVCSSCQTREAKRVARKIAARVRPARSDSESQEEPRVIPGKGKHEDTSNILQFNCPEVLDFSSGSVILPLRITCYCRHHREKTGFNLHFAMLDHNGRIVGTGTTKPIMITDDHKSTGVNSQKTTTEFGSKLDWTVNGTEASEGATKRKKMGGSERSKKRAKPYDASDRVSRLQRQSSSGSLQSPSELNSAFATRPSSPLQSASSPPLQIVTSVVSPSPSVFSPGEQQPSSYLGEQHPSPYDFNEHIVQSPYSSHEPSVGSPPYHGHEQAHVIPGNSQEALDSSVSTAVASPLMASYDARPSIDELMSTHYNIDVSMPDCSELASPAVSFQDPSAASYIPQPHHALPQQVVEPMDLAMSQAPTAVPMSFMHFKHDPPPPLTLPMPRIHRLIPAAGPTFGGIEITVLGANFHSAMQLNCVFGSTSSTSTQRWSDNTLVCILPPSVAPGQVHVWFDGLPKEEDGTPPCLFTYTDETDRALMELALQVVGLKMTGKIEDARNIAMRIVGNTGGPDTDGGMSTNVGGAMQLSSRLLLGRAGDSTDFEKTLLDFLAILDVPVDGVSPSSMASISKQTSSGQTLLHLATLAGFPALVRFLLAHDIDVDARDNNGCTALFLAAFTSATECARALVDAGAALDVVDAAGRTPAEIGPAGFFDFISVSDSERSSLSAESSSDSDEAAWADIDEESDEQPEPRSTLRRRAVRTSSRRNLRTRGVSTAVPDLPTFAVPEPDVKRAPSPALPSAAAEKKALEVANASSDEKQQEAAAATFAATLYRTLVAQLQLPQGVLAQMQMQLPNPLPQMHMPALPAGLIPAWGALQQIPVMPVLVPIQQLWRGADEKTQGAGEKKGEGEHGRGPEEGAEPRSPGFSSADWRAFWEKWMQQATQAQTGTARVAEAQPQETDNPPPAYTPREGGPDVADFPEDTKVPIEEGEPSRAEQKMPEVASSVAEEGRDRAAPRQVGYVDAAVPEEEVQLYGYRPTRKPARRAQKKHDRMLVLFWIPILIIGFGWALLQAMWVALNATKTVMNFQVGMHA